MRNTRKYLSCARNVSIKESTKGKLHRRARKYARTGSTTRTWFARYRALDVTRVSSLILITRLARLAVPEYRSVLRVLSSALLFFS